MKMRNWLGLGRKLVDRYDMDSSFQWVQQQLGFLTLSFWGFGVQNTTQYPNPFPVTLNANDMGGQLGPGVAFNPDGQLIYAGAQSTTPRTFMGTAGDPSNARWDLLVIRYKQVGDTVIQAPSNPLNTVFLNLHDDFEIDVRVGTPSASPAYPAKTAGDVILAGLRVPAGATGGSAVAVDLGIRELAMAQASTIPQIRQETIGQGDGTTVNFNLSTPPVSAQGVMVFRNALALAPSDYTISGQTVTLVDTPDPGQTISAYYVASVGTASVPLSGFQETPSGTVDGSNSLFQLSGLPADQRSTIVFVDGLPVDQADWSLIQGVAHGTIYFAPQAVPAVGQSVSVFYFVNPATIGVAGGTGGGSGTAAPAQTPHVEYPTLTDQDIANGYVGLLSLPADPSKVVLDLIGGTAQSYGSDFTVSAQQLTWSSDLGSYLAAGAKLRIQYFS